MYRNLTKCGKFNTRRRINYETNRMPLARSCNALCTVCLWRNHRFKASSAPAEKSEPTASPDEMDLGDYHVKVLGVITGIKDYEGKDAVGIKYEFTNNGEEAESASTAIYTAAYQNGVEMDYTYLDEENAPEECLNRDKSIKPGVTLVCAEYFSLDGTKADVEFELRAAFSMSNAEIQKTYSIT